MSRAMRRLVLAFGLLLTVACYRGDGDFHREGVWPFCVYSLDLPELKLQTGNEKSFRLRGWKSYKHTVVDLTLTADRPIDFGATDLEIELRITDKNRNDVFSPDSHVSAHLLNMQRMGESYWPEHEWHCDYAWPDENVRKSVVPFMAGVQPNPQAQLMCWQLIELPESTYDIFVKCVASPDEPRIVAELRLASGWK